MCTYYLIHIIIDKCLERKTDDIDYFGFQKHLYS